MEKKTIRIWPWLVLIFSVGFFSTEAHDHTNEEEATTVRLLKNEETTMLSSSSISKLKCTTDADCKIGINLQSDVNVVTPLCDSLRGVCKCPLTYNGTSVLEHNATCIQIPITCHQDAECSSWIPGSVCLFLHGTTGEPGKCGCPYGASPDESDRWPESCDTMDTSSNNNSWNELSTFKWIFIFMIIGYPVLTLLFAIFEKEKDDHWFFENFASLCRLNKSHDKVKNQRRRRNTAEDLVSTDDDESPLEMEIV